MDTQTRIRLVKRHTQKNKKQQNNKLFPNCITAENFILRSAVSWTYHHPPVALHTWSWAN